MSSEFSRDENHHGKNVEKTILNLLFFCFQLTTIKENYRRIVGKYSKTKKKKPLSIESDAFVN